MLYIDTNIIDNQYEDYQFIDYRSNNTVDNVIPNKLYIGNSDSNDMKILEKYNITTVICVEETPPVFHKNINYIHFPINERNPLFLIKILNDTFDIIEQSNTTLVYCYKGVSRSATIVCAYLMRKYNVSFQHAIDFLRKHRKYVDPSISLINVLLEYEKYIKY